VNKVHNRRGVDSVEVAGQLLQAMVRLGGTARLKALSDASGIPSAKVHRYLVSLQEVGLLRQLPETQEYALGLLAQQLGELAPPGADLIDMVAPMVAEFSRQAGEACGVAVWQPHGVTIVRWFGVHSEVSITLRPGTVVNITTSCTGCVVAAHLPRELTEPLVRKDLENAGGVFRTYAAIRRHGIAASYGTRIVGINALSVPVFNRTGYLALAVSMLGHESSFHALPDSPQAEKLKALASRLTMMMGGVPSRTPAPSGKAARRQ
jgi:DNA-binding IclR family transcriptional regulator